WAAREGAASVHAFDGLETLLGQGTLGLELARQAPDLDTLLVSVGGGGLIGGLAAWYAGAVRVVGVEPEAAPTLFRALEAGRPVDAEAGGIAADSLAPRRVGTLMFPIARAHVERVVLVSDAAIRRAQQVLWDRARLVAEPGAAATVAALLEHRRAGRRQARGRAAADRDRPARGRAVLGRRARAAERGCPPLFPAGAGQVVDDGVVLYAWRDCVFRVPDGVQPPKAGSRFFCRHLSVRPGERMLELGAGLGLAAVLAAKTGATVVATDVVPGAVTAVRANAALNGVEVDARLGDCYAPVTGERFDLVCSNPPQMPTPPGADREDAQAAADNGR